MALLFQRKTLALLALLTLTTLCGAAQHPALESCKPASERTGVEGCWILASTPLGRLPAAPVYWTLDVYPDRESAQAASRPGGTVLDALGKTWLLTVGDVPPAPSKGQRVTQIGPLPVRANQEYTAQFREAIMSPGAVSRTHIHSGPEAFYTEAGETCLETPAGKQLSRNGQDTVVPEGVPMELIATGAEVRRGLVLVLHASGQPHTTLSQWKPVGLCKADPPARTEGAAPERPGRVRSSQAE